MNFVKQKNYQKSVTLLEIWKNNKNHLLKMN